CDDRCEIIAAHVRPKMVVGFDALGHFQHCLASGWKYPVELKLGFKDSVDPFRYRVLISFSIFGHTDGYAMSFQQRCIVKAAVLYAPIGMMDQGSIRISHPKSHF